LRTRRKDKKRKWRKCTIIVPNIYQNCSEHSHYFLKTLPLVNKNIPASARKHCRYRKKERR
ncbi:MAG: hypothetical protein K2I11_12285, partial [Bacteroides sp.]|nr:hypothetical protein [Bacteroides sp.]